MMYCRKCGKMIPSDSKFCPYCGESVQSVEPAEQQKHIEENTDIEPSPPETATTLNGRCKQCGKPLEPNDGELCEDCKKKIINRYTSPEQDEDSTYPFGKCRICGKPLEPNDGELCKECQTKNINWIVPEQKYNSTPNPPSYQMPQHHHRKKLIAILLMVLVAFIVIPAAVYSGSDASQNSSDIAPAAMQNSIASTNSAAVSASTPASTMPEEEPDLELLSDDGTFDSDINTIHITGKVKNNSGKVLSYVQIQFALYDKSGSQVGTALANTNGLEPGNTWSYDAIGMASNVSKFKVINLSGY